MIRLSLCMIVKNEEAVLERCLNSSKQLFDEIIIVDTGSCDKTKEIAGKFTDKLFDFEWVDDFSKARNFAFSKAECDYIMWLDADDIIEESEYSKLIDLKKSLKNDVDCIFLKYNVAFDNQGKSTFAYYRERILRNCAQAKWVEPVHEVIVPFGNMQYYDIGISHKKAGKPSGGRNLQILQNYLKSNNQLSPRMKYYYARELMYNNRLADAIKIFSDFIADENGFYENKISALRDLYRCNQKLNKHEDIELLFASFKYALPRAEIVCEIGQYFLDRQNYQLAEYWYLRALECQLDKNNLGFIETDYYDFIPLMQLCVIYDRTNKKELAKALNEKAGEIKPDNEAYQYNKRYFERL